MGQAVEVAEELVLAACAAGDDPPQQPGELVNSHGDAEERSHTVPYNWSGRWACGRRPTT